MDIFINMKPKYYRVLWGDSTSQLCESVNNELKYGWYPIGGVSSATVETLGVKRNIFIQAVCQD